VRPDIFPSQPSPSIDLDGLPMRRSPSSPSVTAVFFLWASRLLLCLRSPSPPSQRHFIRSPVRECLLPRVRRRPRVALTTQKTPNGFLGRLKKLVCTFFPRFLPLHVDRVFFFFLCASFSLLKKAVRPDRGSLPSPPTFFLVPPAALSTARTSFIFPWTTVLLRPPSPLTKPRRFAFSHRILSGLSSRCLLERRRPSSLFARAP